MNTILCKFVSLLVSLTTLSIVGSALSAQAEMTSPTTPVYGNYISSSEFAATAKPSAPASTRVSNINSVVADDRVTPTPEATAQLANLAQQQPEDLGQGQTVNNTEHRDADQLAWGEAMPMAQMPVPAAPSKKLSLSVLAPAQTEKTSTRTHHYKTDTLSSESAVSIKQSYLAKNTVANINSVVVDDWVTPTPEQKAQLANVKQQQPEGVADQMVNVGKPDAYQHNRRGAMPKAQRPVPKADQLLSTRSATGKTLSLIAFAPAQAENTSKTTTSRYKTYTPSSESAVAAKPSDPAQKKPVDNINSVAVDERVTPTPEATAQLANVAQQQPEGIAQGQMVKFANEQNAYQQAEPKATAMAQTPVRVADESATTQPTPGTTMTSAAGLTESPSTSLQPQSQAKNQDTKVAQTDITPGRATRSGSSYLGVGGNIGISGNDTAISRGNFAILSKIGLTSNFSFRPSVLFGDDTTILFPVTLDFPISTTDPFTPFAFAPYAGVGGSYSTDKSKFGFLVTGGIDVPLSREFTATAGVNVSFKSRTDVGLLLGIGYNFTGF